MYVLQGAPRHTQKCVTGYTETALQGTGVFVDRSAFTEFISIFLRNQHLLCMCAHTAVRYIYIHTLYNTHMKCHIIHRNVAVFSMNSVYLGNTYTHTHTLSSSRRSRVVCGCSTPRCKLFLYSPPPCPAPAPHGHGSDIIIYWFK